MITEIKNKIQWLWTLLKLGNQFYSADLFEEKYVYTRITQHINRIYSDLNKEEYNAVLERVFAEEYPKAKAAFHREKAATADLIARYQFKAPERDYGALRECGVMTDEEAERPMQKDSI